MNEPTKITVDYLLQQGPRAEPDILAEVAAEERFLTEMFGPPRTAPGIIEVVYNTSTDDLYPRPE